MEFFPGLKPRGTDERNGLTPDCELTWPSYTQPATNGTAAGLSRGETHFADIATSDRSAGFRCWNSRDGRNERAYDGLRPEVAFVYRARMRARQLACLAERRIFPR